MYTQKRLKKKIAYLNRKLEKEEKELFQIRNYEKEIKGNNSFSTEYYDTFNVCWFLSREIQKLKSLQTI